MSEKLFQNAFYEQWNWEGEWRVRGCGRCLSEACTAEKYATLCGFSIGNQKNAAKKCKFKTRGRSHAPSPSVVHNLCLWGAFISCNANGNSWLADLCCNKGRWGACEEVSSRQDQVSLSSLGEELSTDALRMQWTKIELMSCNGPTI